MNNILHRYHEEILLLRERGKEFAQKYPTIADKIDFNGNKSNDPQTERIIESFAFMAAQLSTKIDDNAENLAYYLLTGLYPEITSVFPPCAVAQFNCKEYDILPHHTQLQIPVVSAEIQMPQEPNEFSRNYTFRTIYPLTIYPLEITKLSINDSGKLRVDIRTTSVAVEQMQLNDLMFYIDASLIDEAIILYASLFSETPHMSLHINSREYDITPTAVKLCGFNENESIVPIPRFVDYSFNLLREVLLFPSKFLFFRITCIDDIIQQNNLNNIDEFSISMYLKDTKIKLHQNSLRINAVPIVNLFDYTTDSFRFDDMNSKYLLLSHTNPYLDIYSIKEVHLIDSDTKEDRVIPQYFNFNYNSINSDINTIYWVQPFDEEYSTYVSFIDTNMNPTNVYADVAYAKTLCINKVNLRNIYSNKPIYAEGTLSPSIQGNLILSPTAPFYLDRCQNNIWSILTQLAFGQHSKINTGQIVNKLRHIAKIYSGTYYKTIQKTLDEICEINLTETNKRTTINAHSVFVKEYVYWIITKGKLLPYSVLLFKVLEQYLQNNKPFNSYVNVKITNQ